jgi:hypothetical protein
MTESYDHGSADNIDIITQFMCDALTNTCDANEAAKALCAQASTAADTVTAKTGGQADAFNAVFGIRTNFAATAPVSDQGVTLSVTASTSVAATATAPASVTATSINAAATCAAPTTVTSAVVVTVTAGATATVSAATTSSTSGADFGKCTTPEIKFGTDFDNRKETSYEPVDQSKYYHPNCNRGNNNFNCYSLL